MIHLSKTVLATLGAMLISTGAAWAGQETPALIPWPVSYEPQSGMVRLSDKTKLCATGAAVATAQQLRGLIAAMSGLDMRLGCHGKSQINLILDNNSDIKSEAYRINLNQNMMEIKASDEAGLYYGAVTMAQLISSEKPRSKAVSVRAAVINDYPRFKWRGVMLDPSRHFLSIEATKAIIDQMGQHKLNVLHWHLSDDQGWRIEIKRYPEMTKIGAWRQPPNNGGLGSETKTYGGFYSQDQIRDIVAYAGQRHITIVPELDMPGHAQAAVASHPELSVSGETPKVSGDWGVNPYLYNTDPKSIQFVKNILDEVMDLFPSTYIHLGGDEAVKDQWKASPPVQAQIKALGLKDEEALQSWFMEQMGSYLAQHGRRLIGWDEILEGGIPPSASIMSWRGDQGAVNAAKQNHDVVIATLYFDNLQTHSADEPAGRWGNMPIEKAYGFEALPKDLTPDQAKHVLGAEFNLWSEYLMSDWYVENAAFPRMSAAAEAFWTPKSQSDFKAFLTRLPIQYQRYERQHITASHTAFNVDFTLDRSRNEALISGQAHVSLSNQLGFGDMVYGLNGQKPNQVYKGPIAIKLGQSVTAEVRYKGQILAEPKLYDFTKSHLLTLDSTQFKPCAGGDFGLRVPLTPDSPAKSPVYNVDIFHDCFVYPQAKLDGLTSITVDMARLSRNYGLAHDADKVAQYPHTTPFGELVVYGSCDKGRSEDEMVRLPLSDPQTSSNLQKLKLPLSGKTGVHDLCFVFTNPLSGPFYAIDKIELH